MKFSHKIQGVTHSIKAFYGINFAYTLVSAITYVGSEGNNICRMMGASH